MIFQGIPYQLIDQYFFDEFAARLEPSLRVLLSQRRLLRGEDNDNGVDTLKGLHNGLYFFPPAYLDDIFTIQALDEPIFTKGFSAFSLSCILLDCRIDQQLAAIPSAMLIERQLLADVYHYWHRLIPIPEPFWDSFHDHLNHYYRALALESLCLDAHQQRYDFDTMRSVTNGKALTAHVAVDLMSYLSGNSSPAATLHPLIDDMLYAGQLLDDLSDWQQDFRRQRCTLPLLLAVEQEGDDFKVFKNLSFKEIAARIERYRILPELLEQAIQMLEVCKEVLHDAGWQDSKLAQGLQALLIDPAYRKKRYFITMAFLDGIALKFEQMKNLPNAD